jgi:tRNA/tmRNA/rRNA uracil-C5-methylase (TrmA/RlmC/RlmD family)
MGNERQFKIKTKFVATRGVKEYRETIPTWVTARDVVLEIGCEWGTTTALIAPHCKEVIGVDIGPDCIERARQKHPALRFEVLDAFDVRAAQALGKEFTKVYIDMSGISGYRSLLDLIALLNMYATVLRPEAIIVKSGALKHFASHCIAWRAGRQEGAGDDARWEDDG